MKLKERPIYKAIYQKELAEDITGKNIKTLKQRMRRQGITLAETIRREIKENDAITRLYT